MNEVKGFFGEHRYLSNFWYASVIYDGILYPSVEHAYQAAKTLDETERFYVLYNTVALEDGTDRIGSVTTPGQAKRKGSKVTMRPDWDKVKYDIMRNLVFQKFRGADDLAEALLETGDAYLEETNHWNDKYWGVCDGVGKNCLGKILMEVRSSLRGPLEF